jgi:hypothetical protein
LECAELYVVAAHELVGSETEAGRALADLRRQLLMSADGLRRPGRQLALVPGGLKAIEGPQ